MSTSKKSPALLQNIRRKITFFYTSLSSVQRFFVLLLLMMRIAFLPLTTLFLGLSFIHTFFEFVVHKFQRLRGFFDSRYSIRKMNIVTTGGTGGHIFPAMQFAMEASVIQRVMFIADSNSLSVISKRYKITKKRLNNIIHTQDGSVRNTLLPILPLRKTWRSLGFFTLAMTKSFGQFLACGFLFRRVIGFGGYASFPTLFWGVVFCKPIFLHEQNAVFGKVNLMFAIFAKKIFTLFPVPTPLEIDEVGMPLSPVIANRVRVSKREQTAKFNILIISGTSGGSESIKSILPAILDFSRKFPNIHVRHQGTGEVAKHISSIYTKHKISHEVQPFFENIYEILEETNICISRSGASSIVDVLSFGIPTIFIPLKTSADDHQLKNANWVVKNNFGFLHKPWESNCHNLTVLMHICISRDFFETSYLAQFAIKRNAVEKMLGDILQGDVDYYA